MLWKRKVSLLGCAALIVMAGCSLAPTEKQTNTELAAPDPLDIETFETVWSHLNSHHFDTNFNGVDWAEARRKYGDKVRGAQSSREVREIIGDMLELLNVSHLALIPSSFSEGIADSSEQAAGQVEPAGSDDSGTFGMEVRFLENEPVVTSVAKGGAAEAAGVKTGWVLASVGEYKTAAAMERLKEAGLDDRRRKFLAWRSVSTRLEGAPGSEAELEFRDGENRSKVLTLARKIAPGEAIQFGNLPVLYANLESQRIGEGETQVGLIRFNIWLLPTALAFNRAVDEHRGADGIVLDLRGNVGGMLGMLIGTAGHFLAEPQPLGKLVMRDNTLQISANPRFTDAEGRPVEPFGGPLAILVDEITASASEVFAGSLQSLGRARIFGRTSSGQALPALYKKLPNGDLLYHPLADFIPPKGERFEGRGVVPDVPVELSREALLEGRDLELEAALEWIRTAKK